MKIKIALLLTVMGVGMALTGCATAQDNYSQPSAPHTHGH
jgi:hypothetical protein